MSSPYRDRHEPRDSAESPRGLRVREAVMLVLSVPWAGCLAHAAALVARGETFGAEATLAALFVVGGPLLLGRRWAPAS